MPPAKETKKKSAQDRAALIEQLNIPQLRENLFNYSTHGNAESLNELLTLPTKTVENIRYEAIQQHNLLQSRNEQTRTCLDLAAMLGHSEVVKILTERGTTMMTEGINLTNGMGYSSLHLACVWNQIESVKHIVAAGVNVESKTLHGEKPIDIARRYRHEQLVEYLQWIAIRNKLINLVNNAKDFLADPAKNLNKLNKDDKKKLEKYIVDLSKWVEENQNATNPQDLFIEKTKEAESFFAPFYSNASEGDSNPSRTQITTPKSGKK